MEPVFLKVISTSPSAIPPELLNASREVRQIPSATVADAVAGGGAAVLPRVAPSPPEGASGLLSPPGSAGAEADGACEPAPGAGREAPS
ncbi:hypothetical protein GCM10010327_43400 [Streptomyces nitrosporeus]|nr:hypothetical protein GCM10010327_43400 [Streptomyces nitrosporeus]